MTNAYGLYMYRRTAVSYAEFIYCTVYTEDILSSLVHAFLLFSPNDDVNNK